jgi:3-hydroxyacyl-CoA dehydrogenase
MSKQQSGVILFVSSVAAEEANRGQAVYGATKGAINGMVMPMARDLGRFGIRVVAIAPGCFETPMGK